MIRKIRTADRPGPGIDSESERRFIYARRENLPPRARAESRLRIEEKKAPARTG